jgi:hypothetical protein
MHQNDENLHSVFFPLVFYDGNNNKKSNANVCGFSFLLQLAGNSEVFFVDVLLVWESI